MLSLDTSLKNSVTLDFDETLVSGRIPVPPALVNLLEATLAFSRAHDECDLSTFLRQLLESVSCSLARRRTISPENLRSLHQLRTWTTIQRSQLALLTGRQGYLAAATREQLIRLEILELFDELYLNEHDLFSPDFKAQITRQLSRSRESVTHIDNDLGDVLAMHAEGNNLLFVVLNSFSNSLLQRKSWIHQPKNIHFVDTFSQAVAVLTSSEAKKRSFEVALRHAVR